MESNSLDALIEAAIKTYSDAEPLNGLDERILKRVAFVRPNTRCRYRSLVTLAASLALCGLFIAPRLTEPRAPASDALRPPTSHRLFYPASPEVRLAPVVKVIHHRTPERLPKREVFPTPQPPTAEELALLHFVERNPKEAAQAFAGLQQIDAPIDIAPLEIKPLETDHPNN